MTSSRRLAFRSLPSVWIASVAILICGALAGQEPSRDPTPQPIGMERIAELREALPAAAIPDADRTRAEQALDDAADLIAQRETLVNEYRGLQGQLQNLDQKVAAIRAGRREPPPLEELGSVAAFDAAQAAEETRRTEQLQLAQTLSGEEQARETARPELRGRIEEVRGKLAEAQAVAAAPMAPEASELVAAALDVRQRARTAALRAELALLELRQESYDSLQAWTRARRDAARAAAEQAAERLERIREAGRRSRLQEVSVTIDRLTDAVRATQGPLAKVAEDNLEQARELERVVLARARFVSLGERFEDERAELADQLQLSRARVELVGLTRAVGLELRSLRRRQIGEIGRLQRTESEVRAALATAYERRFQLEDEVGDLEDLDRVTAEMRGRIARTASVSVAEVSAERLRALLEQRLEIASTLVVEQRGLTNELVDADTALKQLLLATRDALEFVNERVLWSPDAGPAWKVSPRTSLTGIATTADALWTAARRLPGAAVAHLEVALPSLLALAFAVGIRRRLRRQLTADADTAARRSTVSMAPTWRALAASLLLALPLPLAFAATATIAGAEAASRFDTSLAALAAGLWAAAAMGGTVTLAMVVMRPRGLSAHHFGWSVERCADLRRGLRWFAPLLVVTSIVAASDDRLREEVQSESLARIVLLTASIGALRFAWRHLHPRLPALRGVERSSRLTKQAAIWLFIGALVSSAAIAVLVTLGYVYSAIVLSGRIETSIVLLLVAGVTHSVVERWIRLSRRNLAMQRVLSPRKAPATAAGGAAEPDLDDVDAQTRSLLRAATVVILLAGLWMIWRDVLPALGVLGDVELWTERAEVSETVGGENGTSVTREVLRPITLENIVLALLALAATWIVTRNVGGLLEIGVLRRLDMHAGERYAVTTIVRYALGAIGALYAFSTLGIGWSSVQWLVAAVSVGLGFGLQEIFANFVSGLILLLERPVRVGDYVTVGGIDGRVLRIQMRATTIVDWDRKELVVPNREFITSPFMNWSLSNQIIRLLVPVGIAYGSDTVRARELILEAARSCPAILGSPKPTVVFSGFGDNALQLQLRVFIASMDSWLDGTNQVHDAVKKTLENAGIEIAFPQRDLHLRSVDPSIYGAALSLEPRAPRPAEPPPSQP